MKLKQQVFRNIFLALVFIWGLFLLYSYKTYNHELQLEFDERGVQASERLLQLIDDISREQAEKLNYFSHRVFGFDHTPTASLPQENILQQLGKAWKVFQGNNKLLGLSYYSSDQNLLGRWGANSQLPLSGYSISEFDNSRSFEELQGHSYIYCERSCYLRVSRHLHPSSFQYGMLEMSIPISVIFNQFHKLKQSNVTLFSSPQPLHERGDKFNIGDLKLRKFSGYIEHKAISKYMPTTGKFRQAIQVQAKEQRFFIFFSKLIYMNNAVLMFSQNVEDEIQKEEAYFINIISLSFIATLIIFIILNLSIGKIISHINHISSVLPFVGSGDFDKAWKTLVKFTLNRGVNEIDQLFDTTSSIIKKLENMHNNLSENNRKLQRLADYDSMTALLNRRKFYEEVNKLFKSKQNFFLINMDVDNFKFINDNLGHATGDEVLVKIAYILNKTIPRDAFIGRMGGDEFNVVITNQPGRNISEILDNLVERAKTLELKKELIPFLKVVLSIGVAQYPNDSHVLEELESFADAAMYENKRHKISNFNFYTGQETVILEESQMSIGTNMVYQAIKNRQVISHFQKIVNNKHQVYAFEVLARIYNSDALQPHVAENFIKYAERSQAITQIDQMVLEDALKKAARMAIQPYLFINISSITLSTDSFESFILGMLHRYHYGMHKIVLEITETSQIKDFEKTEKKIRALQKRNIRFALDDFGSGYSSFSYISKLNFDYIKVDKSIVNGLIESDSQSKNRQIIKALISVAQSCQAKTIAEGIETPWLLNAVSGLGFDLFQGYLFDTPKPNLTQNHHDYKQSKSSVA